MTKARTRAATRQRGAWPHGTKIAIDLRGAMPVPKGSMKAFMPKGARFPVVTDSKTPELRAFERDVRLLAERELDRVQLPCAREQPFEILVVFYLPRPNGDFDKHGGIRGAARATPWSKPDLSKLVRAAEDAFTGMVWDDDSRIVRAVTEKRYATKERDIGMWIELRVLPATMREVVEEVQRVLPSTAA